jgi:hypothetical protein
MGLNYAPPTPVERLLQADRIALAQSVAAATPMKSLMRGLGSLVNELSGLVGLGADQSYKPYTGNEVIFSPEFTRSSFFNGHTQKRQPSVIEVHAGSSGGPMRPAVWDGAQYSVILADKIIKTQKARREHDNAKYRGVFGEMLPWPGYNMTRHDPCSLGSMVDEMSGIDEPHETNLGSLGVVASPYRQGTKQWWQWYATVYLPQYYSQQQIYQYVQQSPYYSYYGNPFGYPIPQQYGYGYGYQQPQVNYGYGSTGYPSYNQYGQLIDPYSQAQYTQYVGEQGSAACAAGGGYYDYAQQTCNYVNSYPYGGSSYGTVQSYGPGSSPPNVVGMPEGQAIQLLNSAGFNVWELNVNGQSRGIPPGYSQNRVSISVKNGVVDSAAVG